MPGNVSIAAFVLGAVLLLISLIGGRFKIFGVEISKTAGRFSRIISGILGLLLVSFGIWNSVKLPLPPLKIGYELRLDSESIKRKPKWTFNQALEDYKISEKQYTNNNVQGFYNGVQIKFTGRGYELFLDYEAVGKEPNWIYSKALENYKWNKDNYPEKVVDAFYNGKELH